VFDLFIISKAYILHSLQFLRLKVLHRFVVWNVLTARKQKFQMGFHFSVAFNAHEPGGWIINSYFHDNISAIYDLFSYPDKYNINGVHCIMNESRKNEVDYHDSYNTFYSFIACKYLQTVQFLHNLTDFGSKCFT